MLTWVILPFCAPTFHPERICFGQLLVVNKRKMPIAVCLILVVICYVAEAD